MSGSGGLAGWLRLTLADGVGGVTQRALLKAFGLPEAIFDSTPSALAAVAGERTARALLDPDKTAAAVEAALAWAQGSGHRILTLSDDDYPKALLETPDPPSVLYVTGNSDLLQRPTIAIVGSRNASPAGAKTARMFAESLAKRGWLISSGLALGIDAAAHDGALRGNEPTIAFTGTGADRVYPAGNRELAHRIAERGAIVTEFPLGTPALASNFPRRNRLIAGQARGVLVVEAALQSGSLITARLAAEYGREVFAIPGSIHSPMSKGCHALIRQGAKLVEKIEDILDEFPIGETSDQIIQGDDGVADETGPGDILRALGHDPCRIDELAERTGLTAEALLAILLELELAGQVACLPGGFFQRTH